jgi:hypothetical protein
MGRQDPSYVIFSYRRYKLLKENIHKTLRHLKLKLHYVFMYLRHFVS